MKPLPLVLSILMTALLLTPAPGFADASADASAKAISPAAKKPSVANANSLKGEARTRKTSMGVRVSYTVEAPTVGQTTDIRLKIEGREIGQSLTVEVAATEGLQLVRGLPGGSATQTDVATEHVISVMPGAEGLHYLHVFLRAGGMTEALAIAIPVGKTQALVKPVTPQLMPDGRRIQSIPAQQ